MEKKYDINEYVEDFSGTFKPEIHTGFISEYLTMIIGGNYDGCTAEEILYDIGPTNIEDWEHDIIELFSKYQNNLINQNGVFDTNNISSEFIDIYRDAITDLAPPTMNDFKLNELISSYLDWIETKQSTAAPFTKI